MANDLFKLRQYYHSILGQQKVFEDCKHSNIDQHPVTLLEQEINSLLRDYPDIVPPFNSKAYFSHRYDSRKAYYNCSGVKSYLGSVIGRLTTIIDELQATPVTEERDFSFISDSGIRSIIERDFSELQRAFDSKCWKSVIILSGGAIEAILTDLLIANANKAVSSSVAPRQSDITKWSLANVIDVSTKLKLVSPGVEKLSHPIREYRNLVHPGLEIRKQIKFGAEEARIALEVLNILYRDLSP